MKAGNVYRVLHQRDYVEIVEIASGEVVLFWDLPAREAARRARAVREDLNMLSVEDFVDRWCAVDLD